MRIAARADELQALRELGTLDQAEPREGDEAVRDELTRQAGGYVQDDVDAWFAGALAPQVRPVTARGPAPALRPPASAHAAVPRWPARPRRRRPSRCSRTDIAFTENRFPVQWTRSSLCTRPRRRRPASGPPIRPSAPPTTGES
ncbi:hypothetical protein ACN24M_39125 [Streptomyces microflavus]